MIDRFCEYLTNKIRKENPEIDDERAEVIKYGLQIMVGEIPKVFIMALIAWALGILNWTLACFVLMLPYRMYSGRISFKNSYRMHNRYVNNVYWKCVYKSAV